MRLVDKALWESGVTVTVKDPETGELLSYIPEHVYDGIVAALQTKLKRQNAILGQNITVEIWRDWEKAFDALNQPGN